MQALYAFTTQRAALRFGQVEDSSAKVVSKGLRALEAPLSNRFIREFHAKHRHDLFDII